MRRARKFAVLVLAVLAAGVPAHAQTLEEALELWRTGTYDDALDALDDLRRDDASGEATEAYVRTLAEVGRYTDALEALDRAPDALGDALATLRGEVLLRTGELDAARTSFDRAVSMGGRNFHTARLRRAELEYRYGDRDAALAEFDTFIDVYNQADQLSYRDLLAVATAVRALGVTNADLFQDALRAYDEALEQANGDLEAHLRIADLFLDKYQSTDAHDELVYVLSRNASHPDALLVKARAMRFDGAPGVMEKIDEALATNANLVEARVLKARLLIASENHEDARDELERALSVNPISLEALSTFAGSHYLLGEWSEYEAIRDRVRELAPGYPDLHNDVAELAANTRLYREAAALAAEAIAIDVRSWRGYHLLGVNQLRLGQIEEGRASLDRAFEGDPHNAWVHNTRLLVNSFDRFTEIESERFTFMLHSDEADLLLPYVEQIANDAFDAMVERYEYTPPLPIRIELYPNDADFSVRTVGMAGIGALGVAFGSVIAMYSPAAKGLGSFNWASTLWHEMAHVFHLGLTNHRVPRWFSEGLAVHEQHKARPGWGHQPGPGFLRRYKEKLFLPASRLNAGFVRPSYAEQVIDSYLLASMVFEFIDGRWGWDAILGMLRGYRDGSDTPELIESVLEMDPDDFDEAFDDYFRAKYESALAAIEPAPPADGSLTGPPARPDYRRRVLEKPGDFTVRLGAGIAEFQDGNIDRAEEHFRVALRLFPQYGGADSPYWFLALIHEQRGEIERAAASLARLNALNESNYEARRKEAELLETLGRREEAANALENAVFIWPYDFELHEDLVARHTELGSYDAVVRERRAILALDPVDRAEAYYQLARAQQAAGDIRDARRSVTRALEIAPGFDAALDLLLELRGATEGPE